MIKSNTPIRFDQRFFCGSGYTPATGSFRLLVNAYILVPKFLDKKIDKMQKDFLDAARP
jgi:hypothetical protein